MILEKGKRNIIELLDVAAEKYESHNYATHKTDSGWTSYTYKDVRNHANALSSALLNHGIKKGDNAAILSEGSPQWIISEFSLLNIGAVSVPLSVKLLPEELPFRLDHSECVAIFVSKNNLKKLLDVVSQAQNKEIKLIYLDTDDDFFFNEM